MFTGIVASVGTVESVTDSETGRHVRIVAPDVVVGLETGDSVAVDGVCLTVVGVESGSFAVEVVKESLERSTLGETAVGDDVDLERPLAASGRFDGHIVQGHVDAVGAVASVASEGKARRMRIAVPDAIHAYVVEKGSIAAHGVSLTVTAVSEPGAADSWFEVVLIPHTLQSTVLGRKGGGDRVNLEVDVIAKYVERWMEART